MVRSSDVRLGDIFRVTATQTAVITSVYADGFHYHTLNEEGTCVKPQIYISKCAADNQGLEILRGVCWVSLKKFLEALQSAYIFS